MHCYPKDDHRNGCWGGFGGPRTFCEPDDFDRPGNFAGPGGPGNYGGPDGIDNLRDFGGPGFHDGPGNFDEPVNFAGPGFPGCPGGHRGPGRPPRGGHGRPDMPGMPPRRPDPEFLKRRIEESDLSELLDMAGRMARRRPQGGPARGQALILSILAGRESLSQRELQGMLGIQPGSLSELLSKLEGKGLLTREKAEDRRGNLLRITDAGRQALPRSEDGPEDDPFAPLAPEQQDQMSAMLRTLLSAWAEEL